jgi:hypothetical protein
MSSMAQKLGPMKREVETSYMECFIFKSKAKQSKTKIKKNFPNFGGMLVDFTLQSCVLWPCVTAKNSGK